MPRAFDVMILHLSQDDKLSSCGLWMFQISTLANCETEVYELLKLSDSSGDKHDEKISNCLISYRAEAWHYRIFRDFLNSGFKMASKREGKAEVIACS